MMPEPVRPGIHAALTAAAGDHLVDPVGGHRPAVARPEPELRPVCLGVPGPDPDIAVQGTGGLVPDPDDPRPAALAADGDLALPQVEVAAPGVVWVLADPGQLPGPDPSPAGRFEHGDDRGVAALGEAAALAGFLQGR
jgi:hypothetical protein